MKVTVDQSKCQGHGQCFATAPEVYSLDDGGYVDIPADGALEVTPGSEDAARRGAAACPESALTILE